MFFLLAVLITGVVITRIVKWTNRWHNVAAISAVSSGVLLFVHGLTLLVNRADVNSKIRAYKSFEQTLIETRQSNDPIERAAVISKISEYNNWLAETKYFNSFWFTDQYIPDSIENLQRLR